ncbi:MAG: ABC transporter permease [Pseudomonadota bacterium]|nr:ABC transporter permease [Pseudomonadota bacterium]
MRSLFSAEMLKLMRQPGILFWGFLSVPLAALVVKLVIAGFVYLRLGRQSGDIDLFQSAAKSLSVSGNSLGHLLFALGVATVFFLDYRYATWRLLVPRSARVHLFAAKLLVCLFWLALALVVAAVGDMALNLLFAILQGQAVDLSISSLSSLVAAFGIAFLELGVLGALVALLVVAFRSMIGAVIAAFMLAIGSTVLQLYLGTDADRLPLPSYAAQWLRDWLLAGGTPAAALFGFVVLAGWFAILTGLGLALFSRQQLATE